MATPTDTHGFISLAIATSLFEHLKGNPCRAFHGNMKLRINFLERNVYFIPDVMVACDPQPRDRRFREEPLLLVEVLSDSTRNVDEREKLFSYTAIGHLKHYLIVEQDEMRVSHFQRGDGGWSETVFTQPDDILAVPELGWQMSLREAYAEVDLSARTPSRRETAEL
jgi:Uma2 family endonuclease